MKRLSKKQIELIYAGEELPETIEKSIFLAGPTPRSNDVKSWRDDAIQLLIENNYNGIVFIPEARNGEKYPDYDDQINWEEQMMNLCDCILFWIPRNLKTLPAFTTNIEWGKYQRSEKIVIGFPEDSEKNRYIEKECEKLSIIVNRTLENTIKQAIDFIGDGELRTGGTRYVPLNIYQTPMFKEWYNSQISVGNELRYAKVNYVFKMPIMKQIFLYVLYVQVYIKEENRI